MAQLPQQKVSKRKKTEQWHKDSMKHFISNSTIASGEKTNIRELYRFYNGEIKESDYSYITNPYNSPKEKNLRWPARIRNYNIIKPVVDMLMGEKLLQKNAYTVIANNEDSINSYQDEMHSRLMTNLQQMLINELNDAGVETGVPSGEVKDPEKIQALTATSFQDIRAIAGQQALDYMQNYLDLDERWLDAFFHYLVSGETYTYKEPFRDDMEYEVVNPVDIDYHRSPDIKFVEDGQWVVRRKWMAINEVIDRFREDLKASQIDELESQTGPMGDGTPYVEYYDSLYRRKRGTKDSLIEVIHVVWKSFKRIGIVTAVDEYGEEEIFEVADGYKVMDNETVVWEWITEVREGYRINSDIYVGMQALPYDRAEMNNSSVQKLPYNGLNYNHLNSFNNSVVALGKAYQILYNFLHYKFELSIAKNKDSIVLMDINAIPKKPGWDEDKFMYYADAAGFMFVDGSSPSARGFNQFSILNSTLGDYVSKIHDLLLGVKQEYEDLLGISRQRKGQMYASEGKSTSEAAIARSSVITADLFRKFENFQRREAQGLLDISKYAWAEGKKAMYVTSDLRRAVLDIDPEVYMDADLGIFAKNASEEREKIDTLKQLSFQFAQNKIKPGTIAEILDSDNFAHIKTKLKELEILEQQMEQNMQKAQADAQAQAQQQALAMQQQAKMAEVQAEEVAKQADREHESMENALDREHEYNLELLKQDMQALSSSDLYDPAKTEANMITREKNAMDADAKQQELNIKREEIAQKDRERETKKEIEELKARTALRNKTSGEK